MNITKDGVSFRSFSQRLKEKLQKFEKVKGHTSLHAESVIDNLLVAITAMEYKRDLCLLYLVKQFDPLTAEAPYQDYLYERKNVYRLQAKPTTFTLSLKGTPGTEIEADSILLKDSDSENYYLNITAFTVPEDGYVDAVHFGCIKEGPTYISENSSLEVVGEPSEVKEIDLSSIKNIQVGRDGETDSEFRERFYSQNSKPKKCTYEAIMQNLSEYTDGRRFLKVYDANMDKSIPAGTISIIAKPTVSDEEFAKLILDNVVAGLSFMGNTSVNVPLSNGQLWEVKFQKANEVMMQISADIKIRAGYYRYSVFTKVYKNILSYIEEQKYGLKTTIRAAEFMLPIMESDGIEAVTAIKVKRAADNTYTDEVVLNSDEYPIFDINNIRLTQA